MHSFTDSKNRTWRLTINVAALKDVQDGLGVNLMDVASDEQLLSRLHEDPIFLVSVLWNLVHRQAQVDGVSEEEFGSALGGDAIDEATGALLEELVDFFPKRRRDLLRKTLAKLRQWESRAVEAAAARLESPELSRELQAEIDRSLQGPSSGSSSGSTPASPASTPAR
ncbi:MAG: hypothetical protein WD118_01460 [Phycisphaeraceae bacterium]